MGPGPAGSEPSVRPGAGARGSPRFRLEGAGGAGYTAVMFIKYALFIAAGIAAAPAFANPQVATLDDLRIHLRARVKRATELALELRRSREDLFGELPEALVAEYMHVDRVALTDGSLALARRHGLEGGTLAPAWLALVHGRAPSAEGDALVARVAAIDEAERTRLLRVQRARYADLDWDAVTAGVSRLRAIALAVDAGRDPVTREELELRPRDLAAAASGLPSEDAALARDLDERYVTVAHGLRFIDFGPNAPCPRRVFHRTRHGTHSEWEW